MINYTDLDVGRCDKRLRHRVIAAHYRALIMSGELAPRDRLPSTAELCIQFGVSNMTVQKALGALKDEGFLVSRQGKGVYVRDRTLATIQDGTYFIPRPGGCSYKVLDVREAQPPADAAQALNLPDGGTTILRQRLTLFAGEPLDLSWTWYPLDIARGTPLAALGKIKGGAPAVLKAAGIAERTYDDKVTTRMPTAREADLLWLPDNVPVLRTFRIAHTDGGRVVWVAVCINGGHLCELSYPGMDATAT